MSTQSEIAKLIFNFLTSKYSEIEALTVGCDQRSKWDAEPNSKARMKISLFTDSERKGFHTQMAQSDVAVFNDELKTVPYLIEIETGKQIKPKIPAGIIGATNMCRWYCPSGDYETKYDLFGTTLFVVLCSEYYDNKKSKKLEQLSNFYRGYFLSHGCLRDWIFCAGATVESTYDSFLEQFESLSPNIAV